MREIMETLAAWGPWGVLLLGFVDSAGIPVAVGMDLLVILMGAKAPESAWFGATMAVIGSLGGNLVLFVVARRGGRRLISEVPQPGKPRRFRAWFNRYGLTTVFIPALVPIPLPLKVFVISAGMLGTPLRSFLLVVLAARTIRYFGIAWIGMKLGQDSEKFFHTYLWSLTGVAAALFILIWALLRVSDRYRRQPGSLEL